MRKQTFAWAIGLSLLTGGLSHGGRAQEPSPLRRLVAKPDQPVDERLSRTLDEIRRSFLDRDSRRLDACLGEKKVFFSIQSRAAEAGYYTRSQLRFIFEKIFRELQTRSFNLAPEDVTVSEENQAFFRTEWTYVPAGSEVAVTEHLHFSFAKDKNGWRISEIKAAPK